MGGKTLCPIRDIKGWNHYNNCPYTKKLFSQSGVSDVLSSSGRKERFFKTLQKNVGRDGHLTKEVMKKTLGEFRHEIDSNQLYKLGAAILPDEKNRVSIASGASVSAAAGANAASGSKPATSDISKGGTEAKEGSISVRNIPMRTLNLSSARARAASYRSEPGTRGGSQEKRGDFFRAIRATDRNRHS